MAIYREDFVDIDLAEKSIHRSFLTRTIGEGDQLANRFGVRVLRNGAYVAISGTCAGYFIRPSGDTVVITGTVSGNTAYVDLPQACYTYEGQFALAIKVTSGSATGTMRIIDGVVANTTTDTLIDPGTILPTIESLIASIDAAVDTIPLDYSALSNGFRDAMETEFGLSDPGTFASGTIKKTDGTVSTSTAFKITDYIPVTGGTAIYTTTPATNSTVLNDRVSIAFYSSDSASGYISGADVQSGSQSTVIWQTTKIPDDAKFFRIMIGTDLTSQFKCIQVPKTSEILSGINETINILEGGEMNDVVQGMWSYAVPSTPSISYHAKRIRSANLITVKKGMIIEYDTPTLNSFFGVITTLNANSWDGGSKNWGSGTSTNGQYEIQNDGYLACIFRKGDGSEDVSPSDFEGNHVGILTRDGVKLTRFDTIEKDFKINNALLNGGEYTITEDDLENGLWYQSQKQPYSTRLRTKYMIPVSKGMTVQYSNPTLHVYFAIQEGLFSTEYLNDPVWVTTPQTNRNYTIPVDGYMVIMFKKSSGTISVSDYDCTITFKSSVLQQVLQHISHGTTFGVDDVDINRYTTFVVPGSTFTDAPEGMRSGGYAIYRSQANYNGSISVVWLYGLTYPDDMWFATYNTIRTPALSDWTKIKTSADDIPKLNVMTCKIFKKVVCCGDSYTAGYIRIDEPAGTPSVMTHEDYAWPHYMETATGNTWVNCGSSGATTVTWQTTARGLPKATESGKAQAYVIGLMINDVSEQYHVDIGTSSDIGTDANTYYAQMSKIVRELNAISPTAKILINTCPRTSSSYAPYNQAVKDIVQAYKNTYPVHCIDLASYQYLYDNATITGDSINGHHSAIGYEQFAEIYAYILSEYINNNISDFQDVHLIPYD